MARPNEITVQLPVEELVTAVIEALVEGGTLVEVVRCKDCKHFEYEHWEKVNGVPLIVAHEICKRWGDGCKTSEDGFCFIGERKETEDE